jgi:hypothetical protein
MRARSGPKANRARDLRFTSDYHSGNNPLFGSLRLWLDVNYKNISEFGELFPLQLLNIATLELSYKISQYLTHTTRPTKVN